MPRRKKLPIVPNYTGAAKNSDRMLVQKSTPLQTLSETNLTLPEFKILDAYLSRIDSHRPDERYVRFEKGELEKLLGVDKINKADLNKRLRNLFQTLEIRDERKPKKFTLISLFEKADCEQDENGQWQVNLACSASAMEYVFNIENLRYLKYRLKNVIELTSRYSYVLYLHLEQHHKQKSWEIVLDELKRILNCTSESYNEYKRFNDLILKKCYKEINDKTSLTYSYEPIKSGRKVTAIRFTLKTQADEDIHQLTLADLAVANGEDPEIDTDAAMIEKYGSERLATLACGVDYEFSKENMELVSMILTRIELPPDPYDHSGLWARVRYLREKYTALNAEAAKKKQNGGRIGNRFAYFKGMLEKDTYTPAAYK